MNKKSFLDMLLEAIVVLVIFTGLAVTVIIIGTLVAHAGERRPAVLTVSAEARDYQEGMCLIPEAQPPAPKATPRPESIVCTDALCRRVKAWIAPEEKR